MSNDPWGAKRSALQDHPHLRLNVLLRENEAWDEEAIERGGEWLARRIRLDWPGPDSAVWDS